MVFQYMHFIASGPIPDIVMTFISHYLKFPLVNESHRMFQEILFCFGIFLCCPIRTFRLFNNKTVSSAGICKYMDLEILATLQSLL